MEVGTLFTSQPLDAATVQTASGAAETSAGSSSNAIAFSQALKVLTKDNGKGKNAEAQTEEAGKQMVESSESEASEQLLALTQAAAPFVIVADDSGSQEGQVSVQAVKIVEPKAAVEPANVLKMLMDKASQLKQEVTVPKEVKTEQAAQQTQVNAAEALAGEAQAPKGEAVASKTQTAPQNPAETIFGDKLKVVQTVAPELVANNDLQQKLAAAQKVQEVDIEAEAEVETSELPFVTVKAEQAPEKPALTQDKQQVNVQEKAAPMPMQTKVSEAIVLPKQDSTFPDLKNSLAQSQQKSLMSEILPDASETEVSFEQELSSVNAGLTATQTKDAPVQKLAFDHQPVALNEAKELADKMVEQARLMQKPGISEMIIKLKPQHLGEMTIRIIAEGTTVTAAFHSNNPEVRGLLQESLPAIRQELSNSGLKVHDVGVYAGLSDFQSFTGHDQRFAQGQQAGSGSVNRLTKEDQDLMEELQLAKNGGNQSNDGGVDYRI